MESALKGITWDHPRGLDCLVASNDLLLENCNAQVSWQARSLLAFGDQHVSEFYQDVDLMIIDHPHVPDAVAAGAVIALDEIVSKFDLKLLSKTSVGQSHNSYEYQGKHWALAIDTAAQVSAYRADRVDGAPVFWENVLELARSGRLLWPYKPVDAFSTFATMMAQKSKPLGSTGEFIDRTVALEVLTFICELAASVPDFCANSNPIDVAEILATDDEFDYGICMYGYTNYSRKGFRKHILTYEDIPSFDGLAGGSQLGGAGIAVSSASKNVEKAVEIAVFLSLPKVQATSYVQHGGQPGNLMAWKSESANQVTNNFFRNTLRTLERAWVRPRVLGWPEIQFQTSNVIHQALVNRSVSKATVEEISGMYRKYLLE